MDQKRHWNIPISHYTNELNIKYDPMELTISVPEGSSGYKKPNWNCFKMVVEERFWWCLLLEDISNNLDDLTSKLWSDANVSSQLQTRWSWESFTKNPNKQGTKKHIMFWGEILWSYKHDRKSLECLINHILDSSWFSKINQPPSRQWTLLHITQK